MGPLIPTVGRLYLDTNVLIAMAEGPDAIAQQLYGLTELQRPGDQFLFTSELSLAEVLVMPYRHNDEKLAGLYKNWMDSEGWLNVGPVDRSILMDAARIRGRHPSIKLPDAVHLSTAIMFECSHFLTGDERLRRRIQRMPEDVDQSRDQPYPAVLGLDLDVVAEIVQGRRTS